MPEPTPVDLAIRIESYAFECEAGPLVNCLDWIELKARIFAMNEALTRIRTDDLSRFDCIIVAAKAQHLVK